MVGHVWEKLHTCCSKPSTSCKALSAFCWSTLANMTMAPRVLSVSTHLLMSTELHWPLGLHVRSAKLPSLLWLEEQRTSLVMSCSVLGHSYPWKNSAKQQPSQTSPYTEYNSNPTQVQQHHHMDVAWCTMCIYLIYIPDQHWVCHPHLCQAGTHGHQSLDIPEW